MATRIIYPALENYQRNWRNYQVDKNLNNDWLIRLNSLRLFNVINVCEGHYTCDDQYPMIVLLGKSDAVGRLGSLILERESLLLIFNEVVADNTTFNFSHTVGISNNPQSYFNGSNVKMSLSRKNPRMSLDFDSDTFEWFETSVCSIERIDELLSSLA